MLPGSCHASKDRVRDTISSSSFFFSCHISYSILLWRMACPCTIFLMHPELAKGTSNLISDFGSRNGCQHRHRVLLQISNTAHGPQSAIRSPINFLPCLPFELIRPPTHTSPRYLPHERDLPWLSITNPFMYTALYPLCVCEKKNTYHENNKKKRGKKTKSKRN